MEITPVIEARIKQRRETPRPSVSCTLMNNNAIYCDLCRLKPPITYKGANYFCMANVIEKRFYDEMLELKKNIQILVSNNYLIEARNDRDLGNDTGSGAILPPKNEPPRDTLGLDSTKTERENTNGTNEELPTEAVVGECCNC